MKRLISKMVYLFIILFFLLVSYRLVSPEVIFAESKPEQKEIGVVAEAKHYYNLGLRYEKEGKLGNALLEFRKALLAIPNYKDAYSRTKELEKRIRSKIAYRIAILPFENFTSDPAVSNSFSEGLTKTLAQSSTSLIIIEREKLDRILTEQSLALQDIINPDTTVPIGKIKGINALVLGKILNYGVDTTQTAENLTKRYQSGTRQELNPEYIKAQQEYKITTEDQASLNRELSQLQLQQQYHDQMADIYQQRSDYLSDLADRQSGLGSIKIGTRSIDEGLKSLSHRGQSMFGAAAQVGMSLAKLFSDFEKSEAEQKLRETPPTIEVPVYSNWHYTVRHVKKEAIMEVSCKVIDISTGMVSFSDKVVNKIGDEDDMVDNVNESAGVYADPLEISSDQELKNKVLEETISEIADRIIKSFRDYGSRYYFLGKELETVNTEEAIEHFVEFLLSGYPVIDDKVREATNFIFKKKGYKWETSATENEVLQKLF